MKYLDGKLALQRNIINENNVDVVFYDKTGNGPWYILTFTEEGDIDMAGCLPDYIGLDVDIHGVILTQYGWLRTK